MQSRFLKRSLLSACSITALTLAPIERASAQDSPEPAPAERPSAEQPDERRIVVIGQRIIVAALQDVEPEREYDEDEVTAYDVSTIGELLDEIRSENGDDEPSVLVNGQPVRDLNDIADLPIEAVRRIEQLPRGAAQRIGGEAGQRAYNVVLKPSVKSATVTLGYETATDGEWGMGRGEALLTYIRGQDRVNLTLRHSSSDFLLEADRDIVPRPQTFPYSTIGNVIPFTGGVVDPVLSALAGQPVTVVRLNGNSRPTLADALAGANQTNPSELARYRSIRGESRPWDLALAGNKVLTPWLSLSFNGRLGWTESNSLRGLPSARFQVPATNPYTPFSTPVFLALSDPARPLTSSTDTESKSLTATLNGTFGQWHATLLGNYNDRDSTFESQLNGSFAGGFYAVPNTTNPFDGSLAGLIPVTNRISTSRTSDRQVALDLEGPVLNLPAGPLLARVGAGALWTSFERNDIFGLDSFSRRELTVKAGITIPLTGGEFLPGFGASELALDVGQIDVGRYGTIDRYSVAINWDPLDWLHVTASQFEDGTASAAELLGGPQVVTENVTYYDPLRNETVDVRLITGGANSLLNETEVTRTLSLTATPLPVYRLQLSADYQEVENRFQIGSLPEPSSAVVAAFPDRFTRDATGRLVVVDTSTINFDDESTSQLRLGLRFTVPISPARSIARTEASPARRIPGTDFQVNFSHTILLDSTLLIRQGLPEVDLLTGGAIGIRGGKTRNVTTGSLALTRGATGMRLNVSYRGPSYLATGTTAAPDRLTYGELLKLDFRLFADLGQFLRNDPAARDTRLSLVFENILNDRQEVTNLLGVTPQAYQAAYRDPIGRTVMLELRKVF